MNRTLFYAVATYATPRGAQGTWRGRLLSHDMESALQTVARIVTGSRRVAGKLDIQVTAVKDTARESDTAR